MHLQRRFWDLFHANFLPVLTRAACRTQPCLFTDRQPQRPVLLVLGGVASRSLFVCESDLSRSASATPDDFSPGRPTFRRASDSLRLLRGFKQLQPLLVRACHAQCYDLFAPTHGMSMQRLLSTCAPPSPPAAAALPARLQLKPVCLPAPSLESGPASLRHSSQIGRPQQASCGSLAKSDFRYLSVTGGDLRESIKLGWRVRALRAPTCGVRPPSKAKSSQTNAETIEFLRKDGRSPTFRILQNSPQPLFLSAFHSFDLCGSTRKCITSATPTRIRQLRRSLI
ncbi:unnamed protein product [Polarella glacialis]|uniref:Uncharacterized protein n=1 Tax=Polarella glacialis TaxID=89957 RepID=A0A813IA07_POLGL|nr:unnamed protein product [Polarella glacialis]